MRLRTLVVACTLAVGCMKGPDVAPAPGAARMNGHAYGSDEGVTVQIDPDRYVWFDSDEPELVQLHVELDNFSGRQLRLGYSDFTLIAPDGRTWTAVDPERADLAGVGLRDELLETGISEEVFEQGREIDGYIYFEGVDQTARRVDLHIRLRDNANGRQFGEIRIPFVISPGDIEEPVASAR